MHENRLLLHNLPTQQLTLETQTEESIEKNLVINCVTPLRFRTDGRYTINFSGLAFLGACLRRMFTMFEQYGELDWESQEAIIKSLKNANEETSPQVKDRYLRWVEFSHYSGRQKDIMQLGGVMGSFRLEGAASSLAWQAIKLSTVLGAGKNCSFGFGNISIENY